MHKRFWIGPDPQVGGVTHLGYLRCMDCEGADHAPVYAASLLHQSEQVSCDLCGRDLYMSVKPTKEEIRILRQNGLELGSNLVPIV